MAINVGGRIRSPSIAMPFISEPPGPDIGGQRYLIALILTGLLAAVVMTFTLVWAFGPTEASKGAKDFFPIVISSITGLVGSVVGFYFRGEVLTR